MEPREKILGALREMHDEFTSGEELSEALDVSRTMVWKHIESLRGEGYIIESITGTGYKLVAVPDLLLPAEIGKDLKTDFIGKQIHYFDELDSTSLKAKEIAAESANGTVVIAERQSEGRGRMGREWHSPPGGIYLSIILKPDIPPDLVHRLTLVAGVATAEVLSEMGVAAEIKWPNDLLIGEKKVCGILTEVDAEMDATNYVIIGIGINANTELDLLPAITRLRVTSLEEDLGRRVDRVAITRKLLERFEEYYVTFLKGDFPRILRYWREHSATIGRRVRIVTRWRTIEGEAVGIDHDGALIVELDGGGVEREITGTCFHI